MVVNDVLFQNLHRIFPLAHQEGLVAETAFQIFHLCPFLDSAPPRY